MGRQQRDPQPARLQSHLTSAEQAIERVVYSRAAAEIEHYIEEYRKRFGDHFSSDKAAELFPEYNASGAARTANRAAVTKASHFVVDRAFLERLREPTSSAGAIAEGNIVFDGSAVHAEPHR